ncbi:hypothetical protein AB0B66_23820 [Catellatospora sp. NPDC049111]|uniref:hypothetical protein n=1 Tax=Catellatospora sp. NPDC049111 TaxID=3155271 RepID=UPI00340ED466
MNTDTVRTGVGRVAQNSPLGEVQRAFEALTQQPSPLALDCRQLPPELGLPERHVPLDELRDLLLDRATSYAARDAVWSLLCTAAQQWGRHWILAATGIALPGLRRAAKQLCAGYRGEHADVESEVLTGFLEALHTADPSRDRLAARLIWAGRRAGTQLVWADARHEQAKAQTAESLLPPPLYGHPDLLLGRAVAQNVISAEIAELIGATRLDGVSVDKVAQRFGATAQVLRMRRRRGEFRLLEAVREGLLSGAP